MWVVVYVGACYNVISTYSSCVVLIDREIRPWSVDAADRHLFCRVATAAAGAIAVGSNEVIGEAPRWVASGQFELTVCGRVDCEYNTTVGACSRVAAGPFARRCSNR